MENHATLFSDAFSTNERPPGLVHGVWRARFDDYNIRHDYATRQPEERRSSDA